MAILPLGHNYNLASPGILGALTFGGAVVLSSSTDTDSVFATVQRERVTVIAAVVPLIAGWLEADVERRFDLSSLRIVQNGGARLAPELRQRLRARFGVVFETARRPIVDTLVAAANRSAEWYEHFGAHMLLDPWRLAWSYIQRSGRIDVDRLRHVSPRFVAQYEARIASISG
jgi:acyl-CoA synthetase (AMP-forming)/AMP-acid ligase II